MATPIPINRARFAVDDAAAATRGMIVKRGGAEATSVTTDSRAVTTGSLFVALRGEKIDAHAFVVSALEKGAAIAVIERSRISAEEYARVGRLDGATVIEVDDALVALGDLARAHLERWRAPDKRVLAITGSAGKTTTKELAATLFGAVGPTHFTAGNLNNRVGVPFVVFGLESAHRYAVLEMGMSLRGELDAIASFARPDVSIVTNVGVAHAEGVGGREGVMHEKGAVYRALAEGGIAIVNADDAFATRAAEGTRGRVVTFGVGSAAYRLVRREARGDAGSRVVIATPARELEVTLPLPGEAAAIDLVAALAAQEAATGVSLSPDRIEAALAAVRLPGRATVSRLGGDVVILDDTYNANPASMRAALATLAEIAGGRRRVVVLGEMKELGDHAEREHDALGDAVAEAGVALAIGCGGLIGRALDRAAARGIEVVAAPSTEAAAAEAKARVRPSDAVLVKGSRSVGAERVVAALTEAWPKSAKSASSGTA
ncbi:MAG: UDP-N-acetylmuramoyl-tripeptide--D-alanyl-D-alanine ligase [Labilithrix sp.]|nr:UDP-N-acetylmuramoyl-tripeptide--D-alanyl-D-alanine ligase [Labilithrix sp.]